MTQMLFTRMDFDQQAFFDFIDRAGLKPGIQKRNDHQSSWWGTLDLRFEQEFPGFRKGDKFHAYLVISNFCNMLNDDWCVLEEVGFPRTEDVVEFSRDGIVDGKYVYDSFSESRWRKPICRCIPVGNADRN